LPAGFGFGPSLECFKRLWDVFAQLWFGASTPKGQKLGANTYGQRTWPVGLVAPSPLVVDRRPKVSRRACGLPQPETFTIVSTSVPAPVSALGPAEPRYSLVTNLAETHIALDVCRKVWGADAVRDVDLYFVAATHGSYFGIAWVGEEPVGACFGLLSHGGTELHSHMTAVVPQHAGAGVGFGLKQHQRTWAAAHHIESITWTFDPLVRRNAWFNLVRLGAHVTGYEVNYYGALGDAINGNDESDRLMVRWPVSQVSEINETPGSAAVLEPHASDVLVPTPDDIEALRAAENASASQPDQSSAWRLRMRAALSLLLTDGWVIAGLTADYQYVLRQP
jgi:predicted GNAT superfamily acetyltransferase